MTTTSIPDDELIKMAAFKLAETARRVAILAKEAEAPDLRRLLMAASAAIQQEAQHLSGDDRDTAAQEERPYWNRHSKGSGRLARQPRMPVVAAV